jgi:pimeloyl-ACP methyl ester carboxylesterase
MECQLEGITLYYETFGEGRPILMLHGWPLDHRHMASDMEPLFAQRPGWRRIYPDLPGMGRTPGAAWITNQDQMLEITLAFLDQVAPGQRFVVAGASYGAYLARGLVLRRARQMDGLLLAVPVIRAWTRERALPRPVTLVEDPALTAGLEPELRSAFVELAVVQSEALLEVMRADIMPALEAADHAFLERVREQYAFSFEVGFLTQPFGAPALFVTGRQDAICGYWDALGILENYPRATFAVLDSAGHCLTAEQRALFHALAAEWLDRVEAYAA